jgi:hypothetical protein
MSTLTADFTHVQWNRLAEPQDDLYDTEVVLARAAAKGYARREPGGLPTFLDGTIAIRNDCPDLGKDCVLTAPDHPNLRATADLIRLWPAVDLQVRRLIDSLNIFLHTKSPYLDAGVGSLSGAGRGEFGTVSSTVNSAVGFAGSLVHEMAHHKLRALGVEFESADLLILNPPEERYRSPVRYDCLRPMTAVLHGQYAFLYSAAMCLKIVQAGRDPVGDRRIAEEALAVKLPKLVFGMEVLNHHARVDEYGAAFLDGLSDWCDRLFEEGFGLLKEMGVPVVRFSHPLRI